MGGTISAGTAVLGLHVLVLWTAGMAADSSAASVHPGLPSSRGALPGRSLRGGSADELQKWAAALPAPKGSIVKGWVLKHKHGAKGGTFQKRYAVFEAETNTFKYYTDEDMATPKGCTHVAWAVARLSEREKKAKVCALR